MLFLRNRVSALVLLVFLFAPVAALADAPREMSWTESLEQESESLWAHWVHILTQWWSGDDDGEHDKEDVELDGDDDGHHEFGAWVDPAG